MTDVDRVNGVEDTANDVEFQSEQCKGVERDLP